MRGEWGDAIGQLRLTILAILGCCGAACADRVAGEMGGGGGGTGADEGIECAPRPDPCEPFDAVGVGNCDTAPGWAWDGTDCVLIEGCECEGEDCCRLFGDYDECVAELGECWDFALCKRCPEGTMCMQQCGGAGYCEEPTCEECTGCPCGCVEDQYSTCMNGGGGDEYVGVQLVCQGFGRPFVVEGEARTAAVASGRAWSTLHTPALLHELDVATRRRLAAAWTEQALLEHASIASFARFVLDLLAVGAPAELVRDATAAMQDEVEHAQVCFALASAYGEAPVQAGPLRGASAATSDLASLAAATVLEGCVGETLAALEARVAARACADAAVREIEIRIADDELRHAELAWRVVSWAIDHGGEPVREAVASAFARAGATHRSHEPRPDDDLLAHGLLGATARATLNAAAVRDAIMPCARALLCRAAG